MPATNGTYWVNKYGKSPKDMDEGEWRMALTNELYEVRGVAQCVPRHELYFKIGGFILTFIICPILVWLVLRLLGS